MSTDLLFGQFATLATAPDGIARLRELILQLAVQGKLGTQDVMDEPVSVLAGMIQIEKAALIENRKLRENKTTELKEIQEMQYEILPIGNGIEWEKLFFFKRVLELEIGNSEQVGSNFSM